MTLEEGSREWRRLKQSPGVGNGDFLGDGRESSLGTTWGVREGSIEGK